MITLTTKLNNAQGLHARPATLFCKEAGQFKSEVKLVCGDKEGNAKSLIALLAMGLTAGSEIQVVADGEDEEAAATHMAEFIQTFQE
ncbi:MAG: HPr family phosphocarrier protein [Cellulosilyticum sp.]|nr:HPr family phosphocarrier protein [Cellulosilyticum sp.]MEE1071813.1 HPr family phosphocarrier protein [Cellulosilyticum sp.]